MISLKKGETEKGAWESARGTVSDAYCAAQALLALGKDEVFQNAFLLEKCFSPNPTLCHKIQALGCGVMAGDGPGRGDPVWDWPWIKRLSGGPERLETCLRSVLFVGFLILLFYFPFDLNLPLELSPSQCSALILSKYIY